MRLTGIILSGGKSSRMGKEKGLCLLKGKPLIEYSYQLLAKICKSVIISSNSDCFNYLGSPVVKDEIQEKGPAGGIYSCLKTSKTEDNFIVSCDMPNVSVDLIRFILAKKKGYDAVVPFFNKFPEPLCAYYRRDCKYTFEEAIKKGKYKIQNILNDLNCKYIEIRPSESVYRPDMFTNVNTPEELIDLNKRIAENPGKYE
jgi:molybdenum cofactor guanylyltransferase